MKRTTRGFSPKMARDIFIRDSYTCIYCGNIANQIDHVIPYSKDGITAKNNAVACCRSCNVRKKGKLSEEYLVKGLTHLVRIGEDISWVDSLYTKQIRRLTEAEDYALNLLLRGKLPLSEISFVLGIDEEILRYAVEELK